METSTPDFPPPPSFPLAAAPHHMRACAGASPESEASRAPLCGTPRAGDAPSASAARGGELESPH
eukprot:366565-Chlamydomonas_euryale.AAC.1